MQRRHSGADLRVISWIFFGEPRRNRLHLSLRLLKGDAGFDPRDHVEKMITALCYFLVCKIDRYPQLVIPVAIAWQVHPSLHHADHCVILAIQRNCPANSARIGTETALPEPVAQKNDMRAKAVVIRHERAPNQRRHG